MMDPEGRALRGPSLRDAESLIRRLVGVGGVAVRLRADGALEEVVITPAAGSGEKQIARNVVSALKARFGLDLDPAAVRISAHPADNGNGGSGETHAIGHAVDHANEHAGDQADSRNGSALARERDGAGNSANGSQKSPARPARAGSVPRANGNGTARPHRNGIAHSSNGHHDDAVESARTQDSTDPASPVVFVGPSRPRLEHADLRRVGDTLRCRVVVVTGSERFVGVADAFDRELADIELVARVTVDALRAARTPREPVQFEGAALVDVAGRAHVVVCLAVWNGHEFDAIAGAEPVRGSTVDATAQAVIGSINGHLLA